MEFKCPHCNKIITEKNLQENQISASHLKEYFMKKEEEYKKEFFKELAQKKENEYKEKFNSLKSNIEQEKEKIIAQKELDFEKAKQIEIDNLKKILEEQNIKLKNTETEIEKLISQKELEIQQKKQIEIDNLKNQLKEQEIQLKNNQFETKTAVIQKELEIEKTKQIEIDNLKKILEEQNIKLKNTETEIEKLISQKELEIQQKKQIEIDQIKQILKDKEMQLQKQESSTKILIAEKKLELHDENRLAIENIKTAHSEEKKQLQENIKNLELANALNKVIQSKTKGENFEHDVEKILRDSFEPEDIIKKITSNDKKADYLHTIYDGDKEIGKIVYEVKNAEWKDTWEKKLLEDMANENSKYGILIATSLNKKYPGISFRRSNVHHNIYLVDADSFVFIGQLIKSLIKTEHKIEERYKDKNLEEKMKEFKKWKEIQLPAIDKLIQDNINRIAKAENSIAKQIDEIRIGREKINSQWLYKIKEFIENIII